MSVRAEIKPALERLVARLQSRRYPVDVALLRALRDFGVECHELGGTTAHNAPTLPAPMPAPIPAPERPTIAAPRGAEDNITGRYSIQHPLRDDHLKGQKP